MQSVPKAPLQAEGPFEQDAPGMLLTGFVQMAFGHVELQAERWLL